MKRGIVGFVLIFFIILFSIVFVNAAFSFGSDILVPGEYGDVEDDRFDIICPNNTALAGIRGYSTDQIETIGTFTCRNVDGVTDTVIGGQYGDDNEGTSFELICPSGYYIKSVSGSANLQIDSLGPLTCVDKNGNEQSAGSVYGETTDSFSLACLSNSAIGRIQGTYRSTEAESLGPIYCRQIINLCTPKTCANYPDQCANNLSNGCNGTIDCTNNCSSGDVCNEITGYCYTPTYYTPWNCSDNQTIMKLLYLTDSTGALWNDSIFQWKICYDKFFPSYVKQDPHNCTIRNNVVNLSAITNANASVLGDYPIPICFGDLVCRSVNITNNQSCNANERSILSLSALTNARMSNETSSNYSIRICCKSVPFIRGSAAFQDMNENNLTSSHVNDTLRLVLFREDVNNSVVNYSIFKKSCEGVTDCVWQWLFGDSKVAQFYSIGFSNYKFTETGEFYFNATVQGYPDVYSSDILTVGSQSNAVPRITIMKPVEGSNFTIRSNNNLTDSISFEQTSSDEDDLIDVYWDFDDGYIYHGMNCNNGTNRYSNNDCNTTHRYNSSAAGTRIVNATAIETTRTNGSNQYQYDLSRIFVYKEGFNLFIIMDQPNYKTRTFNPEPITISAVSTHVADCSYNWGICNGTAGLIGKSCYNVSDAAFNSSLKIFCYRYAESSDARFNFTWSIDGETKSWYPTNSSPFIKVFPEGGEHYIHLKVRFNL